MIIGNELDFSLEFASSILWQANAVSLSTFSGHSICFSAALQSAPICRLASSENSLQMVDLCSTPACRPRLVGPGGSPKHVNCCTATRENSVRIYTATLPKTARSKERRGFTFSRACSQKTGFSESQTSQTKLGLPWSLKENKF